jgi:uncharacterized protein (TIGR02466 family)|tara:strand:+ start:335 stop:946 length:612 start_codon:yes stop_codon:yes gene_type:complete
VEATINGIFPTPIYISKLDRTLSSLELKFVDKHKKDFYKNDGNITSNNNYILNEKFFSNIKKELNLKVQDYFDKVISPANKIKPYITQSWLNYTETNQYHHKHTHPNSLVSGVFYINCHKENDKIKFFNNNYKTIQLETKNWNLYNSETWWFTVKTGDVILFPSSLSHMVETKEGDGTRISLAFNVFIKGTLGDNKELTELIL